MSSMAGVGDAPSAIQYQALVDRCRMLEGSQAELRRQLDGMLIEKEKAEEAVAEGVLRGEACIPGFFSGGSPYRRILESIGHAVHVCSPSTGEIVYWNRSAESLYGWKEHEVIGKRMDKFLVSEEHSAHLQNILERLSFEQPWSGQFPFKRKSGEVFMAMTTKSQLYEDGELVGVITVSSDATHFNCLNVEHQQHSQGSASQPPQEPRLNLKRIQWHPLPQILGVPKIASSVSKEASKAMSQRVADGMHDECAARSNDRTDMEDDLLKKPVKLAEKLLERLHIGRNRGPILEHDESSQQDSNGDRPRSSPLLNVPGMSETSISSEGTVFAEDKQGNLTEKDFSALVAEGENSFANRSTDQKYIQKYEKEFCRCFNMPKPEDLLARLGSEVSENMGGKITLVRDGEMMDKAQGKHDERHSPSLDGRIDSNGSALSRGDTELNSFCDCEIYWEDLQIGEEIGQGSFAVVHRGIWKGSDVAIKVYYVNEYDERTLQDYKKEIDIIKKLRHPNVLLFMGAVYSKERLAIVTEFLPRGSLFKALHSSKRVIDIRRRMRMALDVVRGMNYLHHRNPPILHRDLKSSNLLVDRNWNVKVGDFGLSKWKNATLLATKSGRGTPQWMAPEVLRNEPSNEKSDVFSFGVVLWELMTQSIPWNNLNSLQVVGVVGFMDRRLDIPEGIDPEVASIIRDCWLSDPNERPLFEDILQRMTAFLRRTLASDRKNLDDS